MALPTGLTPIGLTPISNDEEEDENTLPSGLTPISMESEGLPSGLTAIKEDVEVKKEALPDMGAEIVSKMAKEELRAGFGDYTVGLGFSLDDVGDFIGDKDFGKNTTAELVGAGHSMSMVPRGIKQLAGIDEEEMKADEEAMDALYASPEVGGYATAGMLVGAVVEPVGLLLPGMKASKIAGEVVKGAAKTNVARGAGAGAVYGGLAYTKEVEDESFMESKAKQVATYTAFGAGAGVLFGGALRSGDKVKVPKDAPSAVKKEVASAYKNVKEKLATKAKDEGDVVGKIKDADVYLAAEKQMDDLDFTIAKFIKDEGGMYDAGKINEFLRKNVPEKLEGLWDATKITGRRPKIRMTAEEATDVVNYMTKAARQSDLSLGVDKLIGMVSTRVGNKNKRLQGRLQAHYHNNNVAEKKAFDAVDPFMDSAAKIFGRRKGIDKLKDTVGRATGKGEEVAAKSAEYNEFSSRMLSGDFDGVRDMLRAKGFSDTSDELKSLKTVEDWLGKRADELVDHGILDKKQVLEGYFPRIVKDYEGLKAKLGSEVETRLDTAMKEAEEAMWEAEKRQLNPAEQSAIINKTLIAHPKGISTKGGRYSQKRTLSKVDEELTEFYEDPLQSLHSYIRNSTQDLGKAKLFGRDKKKIVVTRKQMEKEHLPKGITTQKDKDKWWKDEGRARAKHLRDNIKRSALVTKELNGKIVTDDKASIGVLMQQEMAAGNMTSRDIEEVGAMLESLFSVGVKSPHSVTQAFRNIVYASLLANPINAAIQFGDVGVSMYVNGFRNTLEAIAPAAKITKDAIARDIFGKKGGVQSLIDEMGLTGHVTEEFASSGMTAKYLKVAMKYSGFQHVDMFGKEVAIRAAMNKATKATSTQSGKRAFIMKHKETYGDEIHKIANDLETGKITEETKLYLFSELSRMQPISKLELPQGFHDNPNGRVFYMLKSFMLKQMDIARRDGFQKLASKNPAVRKQGGKNLAALMIALGAAGTGGKAIQEGLKGNFAGMDDEILDPVAWTTNMLKTFGMSEYTMRTIGAGDIGKAAGNLVLPPFTIFDKVFEERQDELKLQKKAITLVPGFGKPAYYWAMGGLEKELASKEYWKKQDEYKKKRIAKRESKSGY